MFTPSQIVRFCIVLMLCCPFVAFAQYPPPQGPPPVSGQGIREWPVYQITNSLMAAIKDSTLPIINRSIEESNPLVRTKMTLEKLTLLQPRISQTYYKDKPNDRMVLIPYRADYELKMNNMVNRRLSQNISFMFACREWYLKEAGPISVTYKADRPYLQPNSLQGAALEFVAGWLSTLVENQIRKKLPQAIHDSLLINLPNPTCNCLSVYTNPSPYNAAAVQWQYKSSPIQMPQAQNKTVSVSLRSIKRLKARNPKTGNILYNPLEKFTLEFYANQELQTFPDLAMLEDQEIDLAAHTIKLRKPGPGEKVVLIAGIAYSSTSKDSRFMVYNKAQNYGHGRQRLVVRKTFLMPPQRLPNGQLSKPKEIHIDAYELTVDIKSGPNALH